MKLSAFLQQGGEYPVQAGKPYQRFTRLWWAGRLGEGE
jgi:hypothetical protein